MPRGLLVEQSAVQHEQSRGSLTARAWATLTVTIWMGTLVCASTYCSTLKPGLRMARYRHVVLHDRTLSKWMCVGTDKEEHVWHSAGT